MKECGGGRQRARGRGVPPEMRLSRRGWVEKRAVTLKMRTSSLARLMPLLSMSSQLASPCRTTRPPSPKSCKSPSRIRFICAHRCCLCRNSGVRAVYLGLTQKVGMRRGKGATCGLRPMLTSLCDAFRPSDADLLAPQCASMAFRRLLGSRCSRGL